MRYKKGAIIHEVKKGSEIWYIKAGWIKLDGNTNTKKITKSKRKNKTV